MKRLLLLLVVIGGAMAVARRLSAEQRQLLAHLPMTMMERCIEMMPEGSPPKVIMSGVQRIQEQTEQIITLLQDMPDAREAVAGEPAAPSGQLEEA